MVIMRILTEADAQSLIRHLKQRREMLRLMREELTFVASNKLVDQVIADIGEGHDDVVGFLLRRKAANYTARSRRAEIVKFVKKLLIASGKRARAIQETQL